MPDDASWLERVVVPDDPRELQADVEAYHRERRHAARRRWIARLATTPSWQRFGLPATVAVGSLAVAGAVFAILTLGHPGRVAGPPPAPVATAAAAEPGQLQGLLPDVTLRTTRGATAARSLRPALIALVPLRCDCTRLLATLAGQADEVKIPLVVVAPAGRDAEVDALDGQLHSGQVVPAFDLHGELAAAYASSGVTVVGVRSDAIVTFLMRDVDSTVRLEPALQQMVLPAATLRGS